MGRDQKDKNVFRPYWLDEEDRDTFTKKKNKKYAEFWVDLYPRDILYLLKYPLVSGKMDPETGSTLTPCGEEICRYC